MFSIGQEVQLKKSVGIIDEIIAKGSSYLQLENHPKGHGLVERRTTATENRYHVVIPVIGFAVTSGSWYTESELNRLNS